MVLSRQLFLSKRLVVEDKVFDGGILVNSYGVIERVLERKEVSRLLDESGENIKVVDGGDLALIAGIVDSHVHINEPGRTAWEGFQTATKAAAAGGITTIIDMPLNSIPPTTSLENLKIKATAAKGNVFVDVGFWGGVIPQNHDSLQDLVEAGVVGFKCFLCPSGVDEFPHVELQDLQKAFACLEGTGSVLAFHAEIDCAYDQGRKEKMRKKDLEEYHTFLESRPASMELEAFNLIKKFVKKHNVRVHIVHVSSAEVIPLLHALRRARSEKNGFWRNGITAETCHHYLTFSSEQIPKGHSEFKCAPPIRDKNNQEKLWDFLLEDKIDLIVSDHSPCTPDLKCNKNLMEAWGGISSVQFGLSLFWTAAEARGLDLTSISKYLSSGPAHLCSIQHKKGAIKPGLDADLVFFDPEAEFVITTDIIRHKNKLTPYLNMKLKGVVKKTYLRGQLIYGDGNVIGQPIGELLLKES
ncbi:uncharacterized protein LOC114252031 [Bombyx mandarina]|uniref:allantoinase n=1 Tax=Bombyx mandarina TaxID=7092 RepID=A0A6J2KJP3_BOMMA|nr:uncharacterized protein LOC114252031 [Bombyx mandarina]